MTYRIRGLPAERFERYFAMSDDELRIHRARRMIADEEPGFPCRVSLRDAEIGEEMLLIHFVHNDVETPYRSAFAIFVRKGARQAVFEDQTPPVFRKRNLSLRAFDAEGNLVCAKLAMQNEADRTLRKMLVDPAIDHIDAHNAAYGCFAARIERSG